MATANFPTVHTSKIYAFGMNKYITREDVEENEWPDEYEGQFDELQTQLDFDWERDNCKAQLCAKGWSEGEKGIIAEKCEGVTVGGCYVEITLSAKVEGGYYEGAVFDYEARLDVYDREGYYIGEYDADDFDADVVKSENWCNNAGLSKIQAANIERKVLAELQNLCNEAEDVFQSCSEYRLAGVGRFSNGEAVYTDIETKRGEILAAVA